MADMRTSDWTTTVVGGSSTWLDVVAGVDDSNSIPIPRVGEPLPTHPRYTRQALEMAFFELSVEGGIAYKRGRDAEAMPTLIRHEPLETDEGYARRQRRAFYRNYCRPIVERFNSYVFRQPVLRDGSDPSWVDWCQDVDGLGTPLTEFMRACTKHAQILGRYFVAVDTSRPIGLPPDASEAQLADVDGRVMLRGVDPRRVLNWSRKDGVLTECLIAYGSTRAVLWTEGVKVNITLDAQGRVESFDVAEHGWPVMPVAEIRPFGGRSQLADIAELNKAIFNLDSLLLEELWGCTYSQHWAFGVRKDQLESVIGGPNRVICIPNGDAKIDVTGGDPAQAQTIRATIGEIVGELYRAAGLKSEDPLEVAPAKSGIALKVEFDSLDAILSAIGDEAERVENFIIGMYCAATGALLTPSDYPDSYGTPDVEAELTRSLDALASPYVTPTAKRLEAQRLNGVLHPKASARDREQMDAEAEAMFTDGGPGDGEAA